MSRSRRIKIAGIAAALALTASGCGAGATGNDDEKVVHVAAVLELTGQFAGFGQQAKAGIEAAVAEAEAKGDVAIEVSYHDCGSGAEACVNATRQAITADGAEAVIGPMVSLNLIPTEAVTKQFGVPHLMVTVNKDLTKGYPNVFRFGNTEIANNKVQAQLIADRVQPGQKVVILAAANDFGQEAAANLTQLLADEHGIRVAEKIDVQLGQPDYTPAILKARAHRPAFVALYTQPAADVAAILKGAAVNGLDTQFVMDANPDVAAVAGAAADGVIQAGPWFPIEGDAASADFVERALAAADIKQPSWVTAMTHDATAALNQIALDGSTEAEEIIRGLDELEGFRGIAPSEGDFDDERTYIRICQLAQIRDGKYVEVEAP